MPGLSAAVLPPDIEESSAAAWQLARDVPGGVSEREAKLLALAMACAPARGVALEIGSFKGRSTVLLAKMAKRYALAPVVAVDPHTAPSPTDPSLGAESSSYDAFMSNLRRAGVEEEVEVHRVFSRDLAAGWTRPIRLLWVDGDHTYEGAREDWELFGGHLAPGAIVAMHDVLHGYAGPVRVFVEEVLRSDHFGAAGVVGSIGWAQYCPGDEAVERHRAERELLARRLMRLLPFTQKRPLRGISKLRYKLNRWRVPHGPVVAEEWARSVVTGVSADRM